jgi:hypothetical protein
MRNSGKAILEIDATQLPLHIVISTSFDELRVAVGPVAVGPKADAFPPEAISTLIREEIAALENPRSQ